MTAGTGIRHSEHNLSADKPLRFVQSWITPRQRGLRPNYGSLRGDGPGVAEDRKNKWSHLLTDVEKKESKVPVKIGTLHRGGVSGNYCAQLTKKMLDA